MEGFRTHEQHIERCIKKVARGEGRNLNILTASTRLLSGGCDSLALNFWAVVGNELCCGWMRRERAIRLPKRPARVRLTSGGWAPLALQSWAAVGKMETGGGCGARKRFVHLIGPSRVPRRPRPARCSYPKSFAAKAFLGYKSGARRCGHHFFESNSRDTPREKARAPHTNVTRDVPRCGALNILQKPLQ
jgi:hypothetical protein